MAAPPDLIDLEYFISLYGEMKAPDVEKAKTLFAAVSDEVRGFCKRKDFYNTVYVEQYNGNGKGELILDNYPVVIGGVEPEDNPFELYFDSRRTFDAVSLVDPASYHVDKAAGVISLDPPRFFPIGNANIKVVYTSGYGTRYADLPASLKVASALWVGIAMKTNWSQDKMGLKSVTQGQIKMDLELEGCPLVVQKKLSKFRSRTGRASL